MRYESWHMSPRVYVILDVTAGKAGWVAQILRRQPGVLLADEIEELPHVVVVLEAPSRQKLAESTIKALSSVESATDDVQLLPANNGRSGAGANKFSPPACVKRGDFQGAFESS